MASTAEEYWELLNAEVVVEVDKLRDIAQHGIPDEVRGEVWKYLLGVQHPDKSRELSMGKRKAQDYRDFNKEIPDTSTLNRIRAEVKRYQPDNEFFRDKDVSLVFEHVIGAFLNNNRGAVDYYPALVHLCGPLVISLPDNESDVYYCFEALMSLLANALLERSEAVARFSLLFRSILPELHSCFEDEEVEYAQWAAGWLRHLLAKELPLRSTLRLWDTYFSTSDGIGLHPYVCLGTGWLLDDVRSSAHATSAAVLKKFKDELEDLEHSEILSFLHRLPQMDMDQITMEAQNLKSEIATLDLL